MKGQTPESIPQFLETFCCTIAPAILMPRPTFLGINCRPGQHCVDGYCSIAQSAVPTAGNDEVCRVLAGICRDGDCMEGKRGKYCEGNQSKFHPVCTF